jgi:UDP-glucuronate 4-epimerase
MQKIIVTGAAGFIGYHLARRLCGEGREVLGIDIVNDYYDVSLKEDRLANLKGLENFRFERAALEDKETLMRLARDFKPDAIVHMAAQAGVRYSLENPRAYVDSNLVGFLNILEISRHLNVKHLVFASSSSVYGANTKIPFSVSDNVDHPLSLYAATKKSNELMAHSYAHLYNIPCTGLRFFTVYGSWGRPDMAYFKFTKSIYEGKPIQIFNYGDMKRDFTHVDDIVEGVSRLIQIPATPDPDWDGDAPNPATSKAPYRLYNIGNNNPEDLGELIRLIEQETGIEAKKEMLPMQPGDVYATFADVKALSDVTGFKPHMPLEKGIRDFVAWYRDYYKMGNGPSQ